MGFRFSRRIKILPGLSLNLSKSGVSASARLGPLTLNSRGTASVRTGITGLSYRENLNSKPRARKPQPQPETADIRLANGNVYELPADVAQLLGQVVENFNGAMDLAENDPSVAIDALELGLRMIDQVDRLYDWHPECIAECVADMRAAYNTTVVQINS